MGTDGNALMTAQSGGPVDASSNAAACLTNAGGWCGNCVGFRAGSHAALNLTGNGSEVRLLRHLAVTDIWIDSNGGVPGATSTGSSNLLAGGTLRSQVTTLGTTSGAIGGTVTPVPEPTPTPTPGMLRLAGLGAEGWLARRRSGG